MIQRSTLLAFVLGAVAVSSAQAQQPPAAPAQTPPPEVQKLGAFVDSPDYLRELAIIVRGGEKDLSGAECPNPEVKGRVGFMVYRRPVFKDGVDYPVGGAWKDQVMINRCGKDVVHNVLFVARATALPAVGLLMPGGTGALPEMQKKVVADGVKAVMAKTKCGDSAKVVVTDTRQDKVVVPPKSNDKGQVIAGTFQEVWSFKACGKPIDMVVRFIADGKGAMNVQIEPAGKK